MNINLDLWGSKTGIYNQDSVKAYSKYTIKDVEAIPEDVEFMCNKIEAFFLHADTKGGEVILFALIILCGFLYILENVIKKDFNMIEALPYAAILAFIAGCLFLYILPEYGILGTIENKIFRKKHSKEEEWLSWLSSLDCEVIKNAVKISDLCKILLSYDKQVIELLTDDDGMVTITGTVSRESKKYGPYRVDGQWTSTVIASDQLDFSAYDNTIWKKLLKIETIRKKVK